MAKVSEVELDRIRTYGFRPLNPDKPFEPQYAEPKPNHNDWYNDHKCPDCGKILDLWVQENAIFDDWARRCSWCGWKEE